MRTHTNGHILETNSKFDIHRDTKWAPQGFTVDNRIPMIAFGAITFSQTMRAEAEGLLVVLDIDEYNTSQVCSKCQALGLRKLRTETSSFFSVLVCDHCATQTGGQTIWQRDVNASRNMHSIATSIIHGQPRPNHFLPATT
ncbi:hypothetical protein G6F56_013565 [Rhizopus delemar]|nr:hypothetical protein G6F56_013565 [Rhizopus delemar]